MVYCKKILKSPCFVHLIIEPPSFNIKRRWTLPTLFSGLLLIFNFLPNSSHAQVKKLENINCEIVSKDFIDVPKIPIVHIDPFYSEGDELSPLATIFDILVDQSGYTWFATSDGIRRYNGYEFIDFGIQHGLTDPIIIHLYEDHSGGVWSVSLYGLLHCYKNGSLQPYKYNDLVSPYLTDDQITSFYLDSSETLHIGTYTKGYLQITQEGELKHIISPESSHEGIGIVLLDDSIPFFFQTPSQEKAKVTFYDPSFNILREFNLCGDEGCEKHFGKTIRLLQLADQSFLLSYENVLAKFDLNGDVERYHYSGNIIALCEDNNGSFWVSIDNKHVLFYPQRINKKTIPTPYFPGRKVTAIKEDKQQGIWIGTFHSSAYYIPVSFISFSRIREMFQYPYRNYPGDFITSRTMTGDNFQMLSRRGHLLFSKGASLNYINLNTAMGIDGVPFSGINSKGKDNLLIGNENGVYSIDDKTLNPVLRAEPFEISRRPIAILVSSKDSAIWFNSGSRLFKTVDGKITFYSDTIGGEIYSLVESKKGGLWIAGKDGLWKYENGSLTNLGGNDSLLREPILAMTEFGGSLWMECRSYDLLRKGHNQQAEVFTHKGKTFPNTRTFHTKENELFFISDYYLYQLSLRDKNPDSFEIQSIRIPKKLSSRSGISSLGEWQGKLTYITSEAVHQFHFLPEFKDHPKLPFHFSQIKVNNRDTTILSEYNLSHTENHISIGFITVTNSEARATKYKYRIKGVDPEWIETSDRKVQYPSLPTGTHTFEVHTKPKPEGWSKRPLTISFTIASPYWETWWFIGLCILTFSALTIGAVAYRLRRIRVENALQMALNESQQQALSARMNPHFIFNALNSIKTFVLENDTVQSNDYIARFSKLMRQILDQSKFTLVPLEDELKALDNYVNLELMRGKDRFSYSIHTDAEIDQKRAKVPSLLLQPFVENAIWHGVMPLKRPGHISVSIKQKRQQIICTIQDDGVGREHGQNLENHDSASTRMSNKRLELINKRFGTQIQVQIQDLKDELGEALGTRIVIPIPIEFKS